MDAWGADEILIETVGSGQTGTDVAWLADTIVLVLAPGSGDAIQLLKAGVMEIPDIGAVNKSDLPHAVATSRAVRRSLSLGPRRDWNVPVIATTSSHDTSVKDLAKLLDRHRAHLIATGELERRRDRNLRRSVIVIAQATLRTRIEQSLTQAGDAGDLPEVADRRLDPATAAQRLLHRTPAGGARSAAGADCRGQPRPDTTAHPGGTECP
jgi:LAO/AO transport system kinase